MLTTSSLVADWPYYIRVRLPNLSFWKGFLLCARASPCPLPRQIVNGFGSANSATPRYSVGDTVCKAGLFAFHTAYSIQLDLNPVRFMRCECAQSRETLGDSKHTFRTDYFVCWEFLLVFRRLSSRNCRIRIYMCWLADMLGMYASHVPLSL